MSQTDELLDNLSEEEIQAYSGDSETEPHIVIGKDRIIMVPEVLKRLAVQYDHNVETVTFDCIRYWDGLDMSAMPIYINYKRADGELGSYLVEDVTVDETDNTIMHFTWTISGHVSYRNGNLIFLVCAKCVDENGLELNHWNSELCMDCYISPGMEHSTSVIEANTDIITQLLTRMDTAENAVYTADVVGAVRYYEDTRTMVEAEQAEHAELVDKINTESARFNQMLNAANSILDNELVSQDLETIQSGEYFGVAGKVISNGVNASVIITSANITLTSGGGRDPLFKLPKEFAPIGDHARVHLADFSDSYGNNGNGTLLEILIDSLVANNEINTSDMDVIMENVSGSSTGIGVTADKSYRIVNTAEADIQFDIDVLVTGGDTVSHNVTIPAGQSFDVIAPSGAYAIDVTGDTNISWSLYEADGIPSYQVAWNKLYHKDIDKYYLKVDGTDRYPYIVLPYALKRHSFFDSELNDLRVDTSGAVHDCAGDMVRSEINALKAAIAAITNA